MENQHTINECPTCWGRQEYDGKDYQPVFKEVINGKNASDKLGWINAYTMKNLISPSKRNQKTDLSPISYKLK